MAELAVQVVTPLVFQVPVEFGFSASRRFLDNFVLLNIPHDVHDSFIDLHQVTMLQRASVLLSHLLQHDALAVRFVDGHAGLALEATDFLSGLRALVQDFDQLLVDLVDFLAPVSDIHALASVPPEKQALGQFSAKTLVLRFLSGTCNLTVSGFLATTAPVVSNPLNGRLCPSSLSVPTPQTMMV